MDAAQQCGVPGGVLPGWPGGRHVWGGWGYRQGRLWGGVISAASVTKSRLYLHDIPVGVSWLEKVSARRLTRLLLESAEVA